MEKNYVKNRLVKKAVLMLLDCRLKTITPALILAASFAMTVEDLEWEDPLVRTAGKKAVDELEKAREMLRKKYVCEADDSMSLNAAHRTFEMMSEVFLAIAEQEDEEPEYAEIYRSAVIEYSKRKDQSVSVFLKILIEKDDHLNDKTIIGSLTEEIKARILEDKQKGEAEPLFEKKQLSSLADITREGLRMQERMQKKVFGQSAAIDELVRGYIQYLSRKTDSERHSPAVFLFAGPSGTGKSSLAREFRDCTGLPFRQFDMTQYSDHQSHLNLIGHQKSFINAQPGDLTSFVEANPECVLLFDEIEKAHVNVKNLFLQILEDGILRDDYMDKNIDFSGCVLIFTTNAGHSLYETSDRKLSTIPRETVINAIARERNDAGYISIPSALLSRFAAGTVITFDSLNTRALMEIVRSRFRVCAEEYREINHFELSADDLVAPSVLYSIGVGADARKVSAASESFFREQVMELIRGMAAKRPDGTAALSRIRFTCDPAGPAAEKLFTSASAVKTLFFGFFKKHADLSIPGLDRAYSVEDAITKLGSGDYKILLCDIGYWHINKDRKSRKEPLSSAKQLTNGRLLMEKVLERYPSVPVYVIEDSGRSFDRLDRMELQKQGVWGFLNIDEPDFAARLNDVIEEYTQSVRLFQLARSNTVVSFNTIDYVSVSGDEAEIRLCEYNIERSVQAQDTGSIMDKLSMPADTFADVIGHEHVKQEMKFFISYLREPEKYRDKLRDVPCGLLLYGPAGTGKTMLARAFAHEADLAFISSQGNEFNTANGADRLHRLFATARKYAPSVIFIDEIDALAKERTGYDNYRENALTVLLTEMDGFNVNAVRPVFVIAATNYMLDDPNKRLDPAVLRRFDNRLYVDLPDKKDRLLVLQAEIEKHKDLFSLSQGVIENTAARTAGMSFSWLRSMISHQIRTMIMNDLKTIDDGKFETIFEVFMGGKENSLSADDILSTARHEAGHALMNAYYGKLPAYITITSRGSYGGYTQVEADESKLSYSKTDLLNRLRVLMAGRAAEILYYGYDKGINTGASADLRSATIIAARYISVYGMDEEAGMAVFETAQNDPAVRKKINRMLETALEDTLEVLKNNKAALDGLSEVLLRRNHLNRDEIREIIRKYHVKQGEIK